MHVWISLQSEHLQKCLLEHSAIYLNMFEGVEDILENLKVSSLHACTHTHNDIYTATHIDSVWLYRLYCSCIFSTDCCLSHAQNRNVFWQQEMETNLILWTSFFQNLEFVKRWKHEHSEEVKCRQGLSTRKHCLPRIMSLMLSTGSNRGRKENINGEKLETEK